MDRLQEQRELVALSSRMLGKLDLTKSTSGHVSARVAGTDTFLIRARGPAETGVRYTAPGDVILVDLDGRKIEGSDDLDPPQEVYIHSWLYRNRDDVQSVIHIHPATVVLFTICRKPLLPIYGAYDPTSIRLLMQGIPEYERSITVSNDELGQEFAGVMGDKPACLMRSHGITTAGAERRGSHHHRHQAQRAGRDELPRRVAGHPAPNTRRGDRHHHPHQAQARQRHRVVVALLPHAGGGGGTLSSTTRIVIPAKAGIQGRRGRRSRSA